jgi:hypothetical protein
VESFFAQIEALFAAPAADLIRRMHAGPDAWPNSDQLARHLGLPSRYALARVLARAGLPSARMLVGWMRVYQWSAVHQEVGLSLCAQALREGVDPALRYRQVRSVTGYSWRDVSAGGPEWVIEHFCRLCCDAGDRNKRGAPPSQGSAAPCSRS